MDRGSANENHAGDADRGGRNLPPDDLQPALANPAPDPRSNRSQSEGLSRALDALYGSSLFGSFGENATPERASRWVARARTAGVWRAAAAGAWALVTVCVIFSLAATLGNRRVGKQRDALLQQARDLLHGGALAPLAELVAAAESELGSSALSLQGGSALASRPQPEDVALLRLIDATLFRYHDADPERLRRIVTGQATPPPSSAIEISPPTQHLPSSDAAVLDDLNTITRALVISQAERSSSLRTLERIAPQPHAGAPAWFLLATTRNRLGDIAGAQDAITQAQRLEPSNVLPLSTLALYHIEHGNLRRAQSLTAELRDIDPRAPWAMLAILQFDAASARVASRAAQRAATRAKPPERTRDSIHDMTSRGIASPSSGGTTLDKKPLPAVVSAERLLLEALSLSSNPNESLAATTAIDEALDTVHRQVPFVLDYAERLLSGPNPKLARVIVDHASWPDSLPEARAIEGRLLAAEGKRKAALAVLTDVWNGGLHDPIAASTMAGLLFDSKRPGLRPSTVFQTLVSEWPERGDLTLELASALLREGRSDDARSLLEQGVASLDKQNPAFAQEARTLLSRAEKHSGTSATSPAPPSNRPQSHKNKRR